MREIERGGKSTRETVYLITSLSSARADAQALLGLNRGHWGIENVLHWKLDAVLGEDRHLGRSGTLPFAMRLVRGAALSLLHAAGVRSVARTLRRLKSRPLEAIALLAGRGIGSRGDDRGRTRGRPAPAPVHASLSARATELRASPARSLTSR